MAVYSSLPQSPDLSGIDLVLDGNTVRDRFLTAFILRQSGFIENMPPLPAKQPFSQDQLFFDLDAARLEVEDRAPVERESEPLFLQLTGARIPDDGD